MRCGYVRWHAGILRVDLRVSRVRMPALLIEIPAMPLTDIQLRQLKPRDKDYKSADGGGLYIHVSKTGSRLWRMRYRFDRREKLLAFGAYPAISLARARELRAEAKALLAEGIDPGAHAKAEKAAQDALTEHTFAKIAAELMESGGHAFQKAMASGYGKRRLRRSSDHSDHSFRYFEASQKGGGQGGG